MLYWVNNGKYARMSRPSVTSQFSEPNGRLLLLCKDEMGSAFRHKMMKVSSQFTF